MTRTALEEVAFEVHFEKGVCMSGMREEWRRNDMQELIRNSLGKGLQVFFIGQEMFEFLKIRSVVPVLEVFSVLHTVSGSHQGLKKSTQ